MQRLSELALLCIALLLVFALAACGGDDDDEATSTPALTAEDVAPDLVASLGVPATLRATGDGDVRPGRR